MQRSSNPNLTAGHGMRNGTALLLATLLLAGCGLVRKDGGAQTPAQPVGGKPTTAETAKPAATKPGEKPALQRPAEKGDPQQRFNEALALMRGNQTAEAEQSFTWITQDFPQFAGPWTNLGIIFAKSNRQSQAFVAFVRAVEINDDDATAWNWLGILYRQSRDYPRAENAYKSALDANRDFALAHLNLGILYDEYLRRPADALPHYKRYLELGGRDDLRVHAWVAAIENPNPGAQPTKGAENGP